jgi:hypothetical protein
MKRPAWVVNEAEWLADCDAIVQCARDLIEGRRGIIESARVLQSLAFSVRDERDPDFVVFRGIDSETDALPVGEVRKYWSPSALEREDVKIRSCEERYRKAAMEAANRLIVKYG